MEIAYHLRELGHIGLSVGVRVPTIGGRLLLEGPLRYRLCQLLPIRGGDYVWCDPTLFVAVKQHVAPTASPIRAGQRPSYVVVYGGPYLLVVDGTFSHHFRGFQLGGTRAFLRLVLVLGSRSRVVVRARFFARVYFSRALLRPFLLGLYRELRLSCASYQGLVSSYLYGPIRDCRVYRPLVPYCSDVQVHLVGSNTRELIKDYDPWESIGVFPSYSGLVGF